VDKDFSEIFFKDIELTMMIGKQNVKLQRERKTPLIEWSISACQPGLLKIIFQIAVSCDAA